MGELTRQRLSSLREKENEKYDESIAKLAGEATQVSPISNSVIINIWKSTQTNLESPA